MFMRLKFLFIKFKSSVGSISFYSLNIRIDQMFNLFINNCRRHRCRNEQGINRETLCSIH